MDETVESEVVYPDAGKPCEHGVENSYPLGCMYHDYKHVVGRVCNICYQQWFFERDWRTDECRAED